MKPYSIILSLDVLSKEDFTRITNQTIDFIDGIKIHLSSLIYHGYDLLDEMAPMMYGKSLILDLKIGDIGFQIKDSFEFEGSNQKILQSVSYMTSGFDEIYVTVHGFPGPVSVEECVEVGHEFGLKILLIPTMSHRGGDLFFDYMTSLTDVDKEIHQKFNMLYNSEYMMTASESILYLGLSLGVDGFVGPSNNLEAIHFYRRTTDKLIVSPGFGRQALGVPFDVQFYDWAKEVGPNSAAIIGSMIYNDPNPGVVAEEVMKMRDATVIELEKTLDTWETQGAVKRSILDSEWKKIKDE